MKKLKAQAAVARRNWLTTRADYLKSSREKDEQYIKLSASRFDTSMRRAEAALGSMERLVVAGKAGEAIMKAVDVRTPLNEAETISAEVGLRTLTLEELVSAYKAGRGSFAGSKRVWTDVVTKSSRDVRLHAWAVERDKVVQPQLAEARRAMDQADALQLANKVEASRPYMVRFCVTFMRVTDSVEEAFGRVASDFARGLPQFK